MSSFALGAYILVWPIAAAVVLALIVRGVVKDIRAARRTGRDLV